MNDKVPTTRQGSRAVDFPDRLPDFRQAVRPPKIGVFWPSFVVVVLGFGLVGGLGSWAAVSPISSAVVAGGAFDVEGDAQIVQHLEGGIVTGIHVRDGETVRKGQLLATLDDTRSEAQLGILENQLAGFLARTARLDAEYRDLDAIDWPDDLVQMVANRPELQDHLSSQAEIFTSNRGNDDGRIAILTDRIAQLEEQLDGLNERRAVLETQRDLVSDEVTNLKGLFESGLVVKSRLVARQEDEIELSGMLGDTEAERQTVLQQIAELREQQLQIGRERRLTIADALQQAREQIFDIRQRIGAARDVIARQKIVAPIDGRIVGFDLNTIGAIVAPGQQILRIVPSGANHIVIARVSPADIDEIAESQEVRVRLSAFSYRKTPPVHGTVTYISADTFVDDAQRDFFEVHVSVPSEDFDALGISQPVPGMPAQVMIETGEQTILTYLLDPVIGGLETALVERE